MKKNLTLELYFLWEGIQECVIKFLFNENKNQSIIRCGKKSDSSGNKETSSNTKRLTARNGNPERLTFPIGVLPILDATNKQTPTGGVVRPMIKFNTAITVKWMGSTSTSMATFSKIGNKIKSAAMVSIKVPIKIRK